MPRAFLWKKHTVFCCWFDKLYAREQPPMTRTTRFPALPLERMTSGMLLDRMMRLPWHKLTHLARTNRALMTRRMASSQGPLGVVAMEAAARGAPRTMCLVL